MTMNSVQIKDDTVKARLIDFFNFGVMDGKKKGYIPTLKHAKEVLEMARINLPMEPSLDFDEASVGFDRIIDALIESCEETYLLEQILQEFAKEEKEAVEAG